MLNDNAKKWVAALRSGEYKQGKGYLHAEGTLCCLGVACELYQKESQQPMPTVITECCSDMAGAKCISYDGNTSCCPPTVTAWLGLNSVLGQYRAGGKVFTTLAARNDLGMPFSEIADLIESEPEGLFV